MLHTHTLSTFVHVCIYSNVCVDERCTPRVALSSWVYTRRRRDRAQSLLTHRDALRGESTGHFVPTRSRYACVGVCVICISLGVYNILCKLFNLFLCNKCCCRIKCVSIACSCVLCVSHMHHICVCWYVLLSVLVYREHLFVLLCVCIADLKWRYFWSLGTKPDPHDHKYDTLNSENAVPDDFPQWPEVFLAFRV